MQRAHRRRAAREFPGGTVQRLLRGHGARGARLIETVVAALARHARERPEALALADDRARLNWGQTADWVEAAAGWLGARGLPRGAPVLGWLPNCAELYLLRLACERAGLFWVPIPASMGRRELESIAERVRPAVAVSPTRHRDRDFDAELGGVFAALKLDPQRVEVRANALLRLDGARLPLQAALRLEEDAHALATTGTEGVPKLAVYTLAAACARAHAQARLLGIRADDIFLTLSPGVGPARAAWLAAPVAGACVFSMPAFHTETALQWIECERPTVVCGAPSQLAMLAPGLSRIDCASVRLWYMAGSVLPVPLAEALEANSRGRVVSTYGGADFGGWAAADPADPPCVRHQTVGKGRGDTEFRIIDAGGRELPPGATGELIGRGPCCVTAYLGEAGRDRWKDGWFHTGDMALRDAAGNIVIVGRLKELIIRGGDNVSPAEVEALLRTHPAVAEAAVIGLPDPVLGERVCACVVPAQAARPDLESLRERLRELGLANFKLPERMLVLDALPRVGEKIDRRALAALAERKGVAA